jgi:protein SCO1
VAPFLALLALSLVTTEVNLVADNTALRAGMFDPPRQAPELALKGSNGELLRLSQYRGKVIVLGFGFTSCPKVCPTTLSVLAHARKKLGPQAAGMQVVYVTVDPERDTPERMRHYLKAFDTSFVGGTGSAEQLAAIRKEYGISAEKKYFGKGSYNIAHSSYTYLIDRQGRLRGLMPYGRTPDDYVHDIKALQKQ